VPALNPARQNVVILGILLALQLALMSDGARRSGRASAVEALVMRFSSPGVTSAESIAGRLRGALSAAGDLLLAHRRNVELEARIERLETELVTYREAEPENRRLRRLLGMRDVMAPRAVAAQVVALNVNGPTRLMVVDRGAADGVLTYMPVVAWGGALGVVVNVGQHHAKVRLLTDSSSGVAAAVQRSRVQGIVEGQADAALHLLYVPPYSDVMHGDRVVTSGLDGIFPRGYSVGRISAILERADGAQTMVLEPALDYGTLEEVLILLSTQDVEDLAGLGAVGAGPS
jgi:rod shape-determining protein MreC